MLNAKAANSSQRLPMTTLYPCSTYAESLAGGFGHVYNMPAVIAVLIGCDAVIIHWFKPHDVSLPAYAGIKADSLSSNSALLQTPSFLPAAEQSLAAAVSSTSWTVGSDHSHIASCDSTSISSRASGFKSSSNNSHRCSIRATPHSQQLCCRAMIAPAVHTQDCLNLLSQHSCSV